MVLLRVPRGLAQLAEFFLMIKGSHSDFFFAEQIPDLLMGSLMKEAVNPIYLTELLAAYLAVFLWGGLHPARYVVSYIDNEASRLARKKEYSSTELGNVMVRMFVHLEDNSQ